EGFRVTDFHGRETPRQLKPGEPPVYLADCRDVILGRTREVNDRRPTWFDFDCSYCTGVWDYNIGNGNIDPSVGGLFHRTWNAEAPPPNPNLNVSSRYNYSDNPGRSVIPAGDNTATIAWDNLSEVTADPKSQWFDFRGYKIWKVSDWRRPVGSAGPSETDWTLIGEFRVFNYYDSQKRPIPNNLYTDSTTGVVGCPKIFIPNYLDPVTHV